MTDNCTTIVPGQAVKSWQQAGLNLVSRLYGGRDVIFAIDLTESVGLNDEGRIRLAQIIEDSLQSGDTVYIVPFASEVNPLSVDINPLVAENGIEFRGKSADIERILATVPFQSDVTLRNTDIQKAEGYIYQGLAGLNQCRLAENNAIKPQSVVWLTDAPLSTAAGITSDVWVETPGLSPFRIADSLESQNRQAWLNILPLTERSRQIEGDNNTSYQITVVDIAPTVQEFCTPAPGGKETCLVTPYLLKMLWLPTSILVALLIAAGVATKYLITLNKKWKLKISFPTDDSQEEQTCYLKNQQRIAIGDDSLNSIACPGEEIRGYLQRKGNLLYLIPTKTEPIFYREQEVLQAIKIERNSFRFNCPSSENNRQDFNINIRVIK